VLSLALSPSGSTHYVFFASVGLTGALLPGIVTCTLSDGTTLDTEVEAGLGLSGRGELFLSGGDTLSSATNVVLACSSTNASFVAATGSITAIQVGSLS
jgi:hypothetical protein